MYFKGQEKRLLIDMSQLQPLPKVTLPIEQQHPMESQRVWQELTDCLLRGDYSQASKAKQKVEEAQRELAAQRKCSGSVYVPVEFVCEHQGRWRRI